MEIKDGESFPPSRDFGGKHLKGVRLSCPGLANQNGVGAPLRIRPDNIVMRRMRHLPQTQTGRIHRSLGRKQRVEHRGRQMIEEHEWFVNLY